MIKNAFDIRWKFRLSHVWNGQNIHNHSWCDVNLWCPETSPTTLLWYERWDSEAWRHMYLFKSYSVNWQSEKNNISLTRHPSYVFSTKRKGHTQNVCNHTKAGHQQCAKAILLFPVEMIQMKKGEPENWTKLPKTHVIRHSYSHWSGIAAVLTVEYVLSQKYRWPLPWTEMEWSTTIQLTSV